MILKKTKRSANAFGIHYKKQEIEYVAIKEMHTDKGYSISAMCEALKVSKSGYYKWLNKKPIEEQSESDMISAEIIRIYTETNGIYGVRRMTQAQNTT